MKADTLLTVILPSSCLLHMKFFLHFWNYLPSLAYWEKLLRIQEFAQPLSPASHL